MIVRHKWDICQSLSTVANSAEPELPPRRLNPPSSRKALHTTLGQQSPGQGSPEAASWFLVNHLRSGDEGPFPFPVTAKYAE